MPVTAVVGQSLLAGAVIGGVLVVSAAVSALGAPLAGAAGREAGDARARFGTSLVSALDAARTVKLAAATTAVQTHLAHVDAGRVTAVVRENRVRTLLDGVPGLLVQVGVVVAWTVAPDRGVGPGHRAAGEHRGVRLGMVRHGVRRRRDRGPRGPALAASRRRTCQEVPT